MSDGITYRWLTEADLKAIVRKETEELRTLLAAARPAVDAELSARIDSALAKMDEKP